MYFDNPHFSSPIIYFPAGHVPWLGVSIPIFVFALALPTLLQNSSSQTTVNAGYDLLMQPPAGLLQPDGIPRNVAGSHGFAGHPGDIPQETLQSHPPAWPSESTSHVSVVIDFACRAYCYNSLWICPSISAMIS